jgi:hypothetical protein
MVSLSLDTPVEKPEAPAATPNAGRQQEEVLLVAGFGNPLAADYAAHVSESTRGSAEKGVRNLCGADGKKVPDTFFGRVSSLVLFLPLRLTERERAAVDGIIKMADERQAEFVAIVSTFRAHFDDRDAIEAEAFALARAKRCHLRAAVFRPGHVLSPNSRPSRNLRRCGFCYPLVPRRLRSCFVDAAELFAAIDSARCASGQRRARTYTLLGPNRPWRALLAGRRRTGVVHTCLTAVCALLSLLLIGHVAALVLDILSRWRPTFRRWNFGSLKPRSFSELLAVCNPYNYGHIKVVGYNNGVNHFGQRFPGRTVVSVVQCDRVVRAGPNEIKADCGATIRKARDFLARQGQELYVVPNYSYVCLGTAFFIPIHGSAADYSCVADTITKAILYDPVRDRFMIATREDAKFREHIYNPASSAVLLRLCLRVKDRSRYYVHREEMEGATSAAILSALRDDRATNVEVRKASASSATVQFYKYYNDAGDSQSPVLELPRDSLGRLWDRLEENPVTSFLMHALTRHLAFHCELFFTTEEFSTFWESHSALPLRKVQLRYIRRDGMPHSPFRDHDCVSVDLFMFRRHRPAFEAYLRKTFPVIRANPGKHSM